MSDPSSASTARAPSADANGAATTDESLMDRYCAGDQAAFDALFRRYAGSLVRFLTDEVGPAQAAEVTQVVFMTMHEDRQRYRAGTTFASWLFAIARNTALDLNRSAPQAP
jgi:RNA polymerase sigma-70 factor (ECF subfamily)